jgi:16S rRNA A1518/A1519 N6-dimethyltransferase RsmA/KsgA/DIM1 with predicted DNA glycosylase/AP lyase activity
MLRNTLLPFLASRVGKDPARDLLDTVGIDPTVRPETVSVEAFARLASLLHARV